MSAIAHLLNDIRSVHCMARPVSLTFHQLHFDYHFFNKISSFTLHRCKSTNNYHDTVRQSWSWSVDFQMHLLRNVSRPMVFKTLNSKIAAVCQCAVQRVSLKPGLHGRPLHALRTLHAQISVCSQHQQCIYLLSSFSNTSPPQIYQMC